MVEGYILSISKVLLLSKSFNLAFRLGLNSFVGFLTLLFLNLLLSYKSILGAVRGFI